MPTFKERLRDEHKIELLEIIGEGAQAKCWKARHKDVGLCAVKIYHHHVHSDKEVKNVIGRELEAAQLFQQPSLVLPLQNSYRIESTLATRWMLGAESLQDVADRSPTGIDKATCDAWFSNIAAALDLVHSAKGDWVHADVKPSNMIMLGNLPCLCDFGVAYRRSGLTTTMASKGRLGTRAFMPISECEGRPTRFSDVYAFLLSYVYLRQGRHPLGNTDTEVIVNQHGNNYDLAGLTASEKEKISAALRGGISGTISEWFSESICPPIEIDPRQRYHILRSEIFTASARLETELANQFKANEQQSRPTLGWMAANSSQFYGQFRKDLLAAIRLRNEMAHNEADLTILEMEHCLGCLRKAYDLLLPRTDALSSLPSEQKSLGLDQLSSGQELNEPSKSEDEATVQADAVISADSIKWEFPRKLGRKKIAFLENLVEAGSLDEREKLIAASSISVPDLINELYCLLGKDRREGISGLLAGERDPPLDVIEALMDLEEYDSCRSHDASSCSSQQTEMEGDGRFEILPTFSRESAVPGLAQYATSKQDANSNNTFNEICVYQSILLLSRHILLAILCIIVAMIQFPIYTIVSFGIFTGRSFEDSLAVTQTTVFFFCPMPLALLLPGNFNFDRWLNNLLVLATMFLGTAGFFYGIYEASTRHWQ